MQVSSEVLTPERSSLLCTIERVPTPGGSQRSPIIFRKELSPAAGESRSARKRRQDRNLQAEKYAAVRVLRSKKTLQLTFEQRLFDSVDKEQPEISFDLDMLDDRILAAQYSWRQDQRDAAAVLKGCVDAERDEKIRAAVHLMVGRQKDQQWTPTGKLRVTCDVCRRAYAATLDGTVRKHKGCS